jgi:hypothetical protein
MFIGPEMLLVAVVISFKPDLDTLTIERATDRLCAKMREAEPRIRQLFLRPTVPGNF